MRRRWVVALALVAAACTAKAAAKPAAPAAEVVTRDGIFLVAAPRVEPGPPPAWTERPLPTTPAAIEAIDAAPEDGPRQAWVAMALARDVADVRGRVVAAMSHARQPLDERVLAYYVFLLQETSRQACDWFAEVATGGAPPDVRLVFWNALVNCEGPAVEAAMARDDAPGFAVIAWWASHPPAARMPFRPQLAKAAAALLRTGDPVDQRIAGDEGRLASLRQIGLVFSWTDGPELAPAMRELQRTAGDPELGAVIAAGLVGHPDPAVQALGRAACARPSMEDLCFADEPGEGDLEHRLTGYEALTSILADYSRAAVLAAANVCLEDLAYPMCLNPLAELDRPAAVAYAHTVELGADSDPDISTLITALRMFPERGALERELRSLGFKPTPGALEPPREAHAADQMLEDWGRIGSHYYINDVAAADHQGLFVSVTLAAAPALDGVTFEARGAVPAPYPGGKAREPDELVAYDRGRVHRVAVAGLDRIPSIEAAVGLVNAVLVARGSDVRVATLASYRDGSNLLVGPRAGIESLVARGLVALGPAVGTR